MKINVFGTEMLILRKQQRWQAYLVGDEGKRRDVPDLVIPEQLTEQQLLTYLADVYHENARPQHNEVTIVSDE